MVFGSLGFPAVRGNARQGSVAVVQPPSDGLRDTEEVHAIQFRAWRGPLVLGYREGGGNQCATPTMCIGCWLEPCPIRILVIGVVSFSSSLGHSGSGWATEVPNPPQPSQAIP